MHDGRLTQQETLQVSSIHPLRTEIRRLTQQDYSRVRKMPAGIVAVVNKFASAAAYKNAGVRVRPPLLEMLEAVVDISFLESLTWLVNRSAAE